MKGVVVVVVVVAVVVVFSAAIWDCIATSVFVESDVNQVTPKMPTGVPKSLRAVHERQIKGCYLPSCWVGCQVFPLFGYCNYCQ